MNSIRGKYLLFWDNVTLIYDALKIKISIWFYNINNYYKNHFKIKFNNIIKRRRINLVNFQK